MIDATPEWLLARVTPAGFDFARVDRHTYRRSAFLDHRIDPLPTETRRLDPAAAGKIAARVTEAPAGWIIHTAFCCSTLLARALDHPGRTLVLREPLALAALADRRRAGAARDDALIATALRLCERTWPGERVVVKPSNWANALLPDLAAGDHRRFVFLSGGLRAFMVSVQKKRDEAARSLPGFAAALVGDSDYRERSGLSDGLPDDLARLAAVTWHAQRHALDHWRERLGDRVLTLTDDALLAEPAAALRRVDDHLGLGLGEATIARAVGDVFRRDAKGGADYDAGRRQAEAAAIERDHGPAIDAAMRWIEPLLARAPVGAFGG